MRVLSSNRTICQPTLSLWNRRHHEPLKMRCDIDIWICKKPRSKRAGMLRKTHGTYVVERFVELQVVLLDGVQRLAETNGGECVQREAHEVILRTPWSRGYAYAVAVGAPPRSSNLDVHRALLRQCTKAGAQLPGSAREHRHVASQTAGVEQHFRELSPLGPFLAIRDEDAAAHPVAVCGACKAHLHVSARRPMAVAATRTDIGLA